MDFPIQTTQSDSEDHHPDGLNGPSVDLSLQLLIQRVLRVT